MTIHRLLLAGPTGLVGHEVLRQALARTTLACVHALTRRAMPAPADARLQWLQVDYSRLPSLPKADAALCALGTTIRQAGSQEAFRAVDHDAVLAFARAVRAAGARRLAVVSALGADAASAVFYNRVKGETESALRALGFERLVIARPSLLAGDRAALGQAPRLGERVGLAMSRPFQRLIPASVRPIQAAVVARALLCALDQGGSGVQVIESAELQQLGQA